MDATWIAPLKRPRGGFANVTIKKFLAHLRQNVAKLTNKQKSMMKKEIEMEWDHTHDIQDYFTAMETKQMKLERWSITVETEDMVTAAVNQMQDSGIFDHKFMRGWEQKEEHMKTWEEMKNYFTDEYRAIKTYGGGTIKNFESINSMEEQGTEVSDFFEDFRRDAMVNAEQLNAMQASFKGAAETMAEVMARLKAALAEIKTLNKTVEKLTDSNNQLASSNKTLTNVVASLEKKVKQNYNAAPKEKAPGGQKEKEEAVEKQDPEMAECPCCGNVHRTPWKDHCWELAKNAHRRKYRNTYRNKA
jgi:chromosome segregation ATPase